LVRQELLEIVVRLVYLERLVQPEVLAHVGLLALEDVSEIQVLMETWDYQEMMGRVERLVQMAQRDSQELLGLLEHREAEDHPVFKEKMVHRELQDHQAQKVQRVRMGQLEHQD